MRKTTWVEIGVDWRPRGELEDGFHKIQNLYMSKDIDLYVLSGRDGDHQMNSYHYVGRAVDIRGGVTKKELIDALGNDFDVIEYTWGFHVEYDPK